MSLDSFSKIKFLILTLGAPVESHRAGLAFHATVVFIESLFNYFHVYT